MANIPDVVCWLTDNLGWSRDCSDIAIVEAHGSLSFWTLVRFPEK